MSTATSPPSKAPKAMSSKLLTMKFMQRAASSPPLSISTPDQLSPKHQRNGTSSLASLDIESLTDKRAIQAALAAEEAKKQIALERQATDAGDTRWVLNFKSDIKTPHVQDKAALRVVETGFAAIDHTFPKQITITTSEDIGSDSPFIVGRRSFGKFNRTIEVFLTRRGNIWYNTNLGLQKFHDPSIEESSDSVLNEDQSEDSSEVDEDDDPDATNALIKAAQQAAARKLKAERHERRKAEKAELVRVADKKKHIKLNHLTSISGKGTNQTCYRCGKIGHLQTDCPKRDRGRDDQDDRPKPKRSK